MTLREGAGRPYLARQSGAILVSVTRAQGVVAMENSAVVTHPLISLHAGASVADAAQMMSDCSMGAVGVLGSDKGFIGIFTERDLAGLVATHADPSEVTLAEVVNDFPVIVDGPVSDSEARERMASAHIRHLLVLEDDDVRIVSMRDLVLAPGRGPGGDTAGAGWPYGVTADLSTMES